MIVCSFITTLSNTVALKFYHCSMTWRWCEMMLAEYSTQRTRSMRHIWHINTDNLICGRWRLPIFILCYSGLRRLRSDFRLRHRSHWLLSVSGMGDRWEKADWHPACIALLSSVVLGSLGLGLLPSLISMVAELFCAAGARIGRGMYQVRWVLCCSFLSLRSFRLRWLLFPRFVHCRRRGGRHTDRRTRGLQSSFQVDGALFLLVWFFVLHRLWLAIVAKSVGSSTLGRRYGRWRFAGTFNDSVFGSLGAGQLVASNNVVASFFGGPASSIVLGPPSSFWRRRNSKQSTFRLMWTKTPRSICKGLCYFFFFCQVLLCKGLVVMFLCF
jgi:hypothetical protein